MEPIVRYRERRFDGKRDFELFADRIQIRGTTSLQSTFEVAVPLHLLSAEVARVRVRHRGFWSGMWMSLVSCLGVTVLVGVYPVLAPLIALAISTAAGGLLLMVATIRKVEFATFLSRAGVRTLDVARSGPDVKQFESFVLLISKHVAEAKSPVA